MKNLLFLCAATFVLLIGMQKDEPVSPVNIFGFTDYEEAAANLGVYIHVFDITEGGMYMRETGYGSTGLTQWELGAVMTKVDLTSNTAWSFLGQPS